MKIGKITIPSWGDVQIWENKSFEWQFEGPKFMKDDLFEFKLNWSRKRHHAGISFYFGIAKLFWIGLSIYDHRHWDYDNDTWQTPEPPPESK